MYSEDLFLALKTLLPTFAFGVISLPISYKLFPRLIDKGYFLGKLVGLFIVSYSLFLLSTLRILPLSLHSLVILCLIWAFANFFVWKKSKVTAIPWKVLILEEISFLILFSIFIFFKGHQPEIYQIERFMDFGFIKALTQSQFLPLEDIWKSGSPLNYYYFGHFLAFVLITLSKVPIVAGFFLIQCWVFTSAGIIAFITGSSIVSNWGKSRNWVFLAGAISFFAVIFAGDWQTFSWLAKSILASLQNLPDPAYWYPDPTRIIPGTISELPTYSYIVADLHAHVWGFLLGSVVICALVSFWYQKSDLLKTMVILFFLLGLSIMANTWDFLTLGSIVFVVAVLKTKHLFAIAILFLMSLLVSLPWLYYFRFPVGGIGLVTNRSPIGPWLLFWGPSLFLILIYFVSKLKHRPSFQKEGLLIIIFLASLFWIAFMEVFYAKDILTGGEWFRANTYFKVSLQVLLWVGLMTGPAIFVIVSKSKSISKYIICLVLATWFATRFAYPIKAIHQANLENKSYTGFASGLDFWKTRFPKDFAAYDFLSKQQKGVILEADGDSYQDTSFFSTFLGWPTVTGWAVHEWTWHGSYDDVGKRAADVNEVYSGSDKKTAGDILKKYRVRYIIIGTAEKRKYKGLNLEKLKSLGRAIFQNQESMVILVH